MATRLDSNSRVGHSGRPSHDTRVPPMKSSLDSVFPPLRRDTPPLGGFDVANRWRQASTVRAHPAGPACTEPARGFSPASNVVAGGELSIVHEPEYHYIALEAVSLVDDSARGGSAAGRRCRQSPVEIVSSPPKNPLRHPSDQIAGARCPARKAEAGAGINFPLPDSKEERRHEAAMPPTILLDKEDHIHGARTAPPHTKCGDGLPGPKRWARLRRIPFIVYILSTIQTTVLSRSSLKRPS